jgi:transposase-like protein
MALTTVYCVYCNSDQVNKHGFQCGRQRYRCQVESCGRSFLLTYKNRGWLDSVKQQIVDMCINGSGIRDTARVLKVSATTVITTIKKSVQFSESRLLVLE